MTIIYLYLKINYTLHVKMAVVEAPGAKDTRVCGVLPSSFLLLVTPSPLPGGECIMFPQL